jgi:hypothetical protein
VFHAGLLFAVHGRPIWTTALLDFYLQGLRRGADISCEAYPLNGPDVLMALRAQKELERLDVLVAGSISPWKEATALFLNARSVTACDYNKPIVTDPSHIHARRLHQEHRAV